jgi:hypothetical protein
MEAINDHFKENLLVGWVSCFHMKNINFNKFGSNKLADVHVIIL